MENETISQPYPGLRPFNTHEKEIYCGRSKQIDTLKQKLMKNKLIAIVGPSGSGKSSLINAGLIPEVEKDAFTIIAVRPKNTPLQSLAESLYDCFRWECDQKQITPESIKEMLEHSFLGLIEFFKSIELSDNHKTLIIIDQFEEILRYVPQPDGNSEASAFVYVLEKTIMTASLPLYFVISIRSDNIGDCMKFFDLSEMVTHNIFLIPKLYPREYREIIKGPLSHESFKDITVMKPELVNRIISDLSNKQDQLPILQHALWLMWHQQQNNDTIVFDIQRYSDIGGLKFCINKNADAIFNGLKDNQKIIAEKIFKSLINADRNREDTRRPMVDIDAIACELEMFSIEDISEVITFFCNEQCYFLKTEIKKNSRSTKKGNDFFRYVEISHECIIRQWHRLNQWWEEEIEAIKIFELLLDRVSENRKKNGFVRLDDYNLDKANNWIQDNKPNRYWARRYNNQTIEMSAKDVFFNDVIAFIKTSNQARQDERHKENQKQERIKTIKKKAIMGTIVSLVFVVITLSLMYYQSKKYHNLSYEYCLLQATLNIKVNQFNKADKLLKKTTEIDDKVTLSRKFSKHLIQWYIHSVAISPVHQQRILLTNTIITSRCCYISGQNVLLSGTKNGTILWFDLEKNIIIKSRKAHDKPIINLIIHPANEWFISASNDGIIKQWSLKTDELLNQWCYHDDKLALDPVDTQFQDTNDSNQIFFVNDKKTVFLCKMTDDARYMAYGSEDAIVIRNIHNNILLKNIIYAESTINDIDLFYKNDQLNLAIADNESLYLWQSGNKSLFSRFTEPVMNIAVSNNNNIYGATRQSIYILENNFFSLEIAPLPDAISQLYVDQHENVIAVTTGKTIYVNNMQKDYQKIFDKHDFSVAGIVLASNRILSVDNQGTINTWIPDSQLWQKQKTDEIPSAIALSADHNTLFAAGTNGVLKTLSCNNLEIIKQANLTDPIHEIKVSRDNQRLALKMARQVIIVDTGFTPLFDIGRHDFEDICFMPHTNQLAALHANGKLSLCDSTSTQTLQIKNLNRDIFEEQMTTFDIHPDGTQFTMASSIGYVYLISYPERVVLHAIQVSSKAIKKVTYGKSGQDILCINEDDDIIMINLSSPENFSSLTFIDHQAKVLSAGFLHDSQHIVSVDQNRKIHFWDLKTRSELFHIDLPVEPSSGDDSVIDFAYHCKDYHHCIFTVALRNKTIVHYLYDTDDMPGRLEK